MKFMMKGRKQTMTKNRNKILVAIIAVLVALCCAFGVSLAYFTDSASIHAGIKTTKLTGEIGQTIALGTPQSDEIWRESLGTVKDGDSTLYEALDTDIKDGTATKADIKTVTVSRGNALAVNDDGSMNQNQFFKTSFKNNGSVDEVIYPEIRLTGLNGENLSQYKDILGIAEPDTSGTLSKALAFQNVIDGTAENLLHGKSWNVDSTATKVVANDDGSLSLYLPGIALKPGESVEKTYTITENMVGHTDYSCPTVAVTVNATIRYSNVGNAMWYGIVTSDVADSTVKYTLAPDIQTRVLWQSVTGKYTVRGGQDAFLVYDKDNAEALSALDYSVAKYQYSGKDMTPTAYLFGDKVDVKVYKLTNGAWGPAENNAAVERGSYKAVADTTNTDGFAVSHTEFYFDVVKATSNVSFDNKVGEDGKPNPDNKLTWTGDTADKEYDGKQVDIVGKDKDGNTITDFIYTNKDTGESSEIPPKDAGTYEVKPKGDDNHDYTNTATITIRKKTLQVTPTVSKNPLLPTDKPGFGYTVSGFVEGDNELDINGKKVQYIVDGVEAPSSGKSYAVGDHTLTCSGLTAKNYDFVYGITSFAVGKGTTTVNFENKPGTDGKDDPNNHLTWANANSATKVYDGVALSVQARDSDGSVVEVEYYTSDGKTKLDAAPKNVGIYVVKACDSENYTYSNSGTITISKATVHVTPVLDKTEMNYTDMVPANITYDIQGIVAGDEKYFDESAIGYIPYYEPSNTEYAAGMYNWTQKTTFRPTDYSYAGKYTLDACCEWHTDSYYCKSDNYMLDWGSATIQVNPIKLTPGTEDSNVTIKGDSVTKVYDGKPIDFKFVSTENKSYFNVAYIDSNGNELQSAPKDVGTYTVRPGKTLSKYGQIDSYPTIIITPAELTATAKTDAETYTPTKKPVLSYELSGFVNSEPSAVVDASGIKYYVDGNDAEASGKGYATGTHTVSISGLTASNYTIKYVDATFTVGKQKVTVTYDESGDNKTLSWTGDVATKVYDGKPAIVTGVDSEGNAIADILYVSDDGTSSTTSPTAVGTYTIKPASNEDYEYTNNGTLIITPAPLSVTAGDVQVKDNEKPEFTVAYSGFVNGETADAVVTGTPTYTVTKDGAEVSADENGYFPVGEYTVTASGLTATNYTITYKVGTMTVETSVVKPILRSHSWSDTTDFMAYKSTITGITFLDEGTVPESPTHGPWDVSAAQDGSATAWMDGTEVYIAGNGTGTIAMPENSSAWFGSMSKLTAINGMDILDTSNVTNMDNLFDSCSSLTSVDLSGLDLGKVTQMRNMFAICTSLQSVDMHDLNTANLKLFSNVFNRCESLTSVNMSGMDTHNVTDINYMFGRCLALKQFDVGTLGLTSFDTSKVTNMSSLFYGCSNLESVDLTGFDTSSLTDMSGMFHECSKLTSVNWGENFDTSKVTNMGMLFSKCPSLETVDISKLDTSNVTNMAQVFYGDIKLKSIDLSTFKTSNVTSMSNMFGNCNSLQELNLSNFDTSKVTDMSDMFANCINLKSLDISSFNTSSVVYMQQMFFGCTSLPELNVTSFNTSNVKNMGEMFSNCIALTSLDLSSFDTAKVNYMQQMFYQDYNLKTIYASDKFVTTVAWSSKQMFDGCTALVGGNGTVYDSKNVGSGYAHIDAADNPGYFTSITAKNSAEDETKPVVVNTDEVVDAAPTPEPEVEETVEPAESETTGSPAESSAESTAEYESEESTTDETVTE